MMDIDTAAIVIHQTAKDHGFWDKDRNFGEMLMLVTSELAEALEEDRNETPTVYWKHDEEICSASPYDNQGYVGCACVPKPEGALVELIDAIIRLLDMTQHVAARTPYTISDVLHIKMEYNRQREHMHGKAY